MAGFWARQSFMIPGRGQYGEEDGSLTKIRTLEDERDIRHAFDLADMQVDAATDDLTRPEGGAVGRRLSMYIQLHGRDEINRSKEVRIGIRTRSDKSDKSDRSDRLDKIRQNQKIKDLETKRGRQRH